MLPACSFREGGYLEKRMAKATTARIKGFVREELDLLRAELHAGGMKISDKDDIPNALILAARRSPLEAIKAVIETYWGREAAEAAAESPDEREG
jgi:hypothetical protein